MGVRWRIGDSKAVNIWNDAWLPRLGNGRVQCQHIDIRYSMVSDLIDRDFVTWKHDAIRSLFGEEQLERILSIPLANSEPQDELILRGDNTGIYTVISGYKWLITGEGSRIQNKFLYQFFTKIWALNVPSKIRIHMWKVANEFLPVLHNLRARKLVVNTFCLIYQVEKETVSHLFQDCSFIQQENISDLIMAKVKLCLQAVTMAEEMGFQDICVEGDAL
ncbi:hypothetical protein Goari_004488, partial [Gossypium aridum]|nr:hypothetical protein [Gossypium aridum]